MKKGYTRRILSTVTALIIAMTSVFAMSIDASAISYSSRSAVYGEDSLISYASWYFGTGGEYSDNYITGFLYVAPDGNLWLATYGEDQCFLQEKSTAGEMKFEYGDKYGYEEWYKYVSESDKKKIKADSVYRQEKPIKIASNVRSVYSMDSYTYILKKNGVLYRLYPDLPEKKSIVGKKMTDIKFKTQKVMSDVVSADLLYSAKYYSDELRVITKDKTLYTVYHTNGKYIKEKLLDNVIQHSITFQDIRYGYQNAYHEAAVKTDGTLWEWGEGLCANGKTYTRAAPLKTPQKTMSNVKSVELYTYYDLNNVNHQQAYDYGGMAILNSGKVVAWGKKYLYRDEKSKDYVKNYGTTPVTIYNSGIEKIAWHDGMEAVVSPQGVLKMKGNNSLNKWNFIGCTSISSDKLLKQATDVRTVIFRDYFGNDNHNPWLIIKNDGSVWEIAHDTNTSKNYMFKLAEGILPGTGEFKITNKFNIKLTWEGYSDAKSYYITCDSAGQKDSIQDISVDTTFYAHVKEEGTYTFTVVPLGGKHHGEKIKITATTQEL